MANAGRVSIVPKGEYDVSAVYKRLDYVRHENNTYVAKKDVPAGTDVSNTEYWMLCTDNTVTLADADTLDGHPASDFIFREYGRMNGVDLIATAENATICPAESATRFRAFEPTNAPETNGDYFVEVSKISNEYINIIAISVRGSNVFVKTKRANTWMDWKRCVLGENIINRCYLKEPLTISTGGNWDNINIYDANNVSTRIRCGSVLEDRAQCDITVSEDNTDNNRVGLRLYRDLKNGGALRDDALTLFNVVNGTNASYSVLHTGNSTRVVTSSTAPSDTSALWIS